MDRGHCFTFAEYVRLERDSNVKHEFYDGEIFAMAGGSIEHAALAAALTTALSNGLRGGPCRAFSADLRVRVLATGLATYPDVTVVCGELERDPDDRNTVTNPTLVVEVLSPSTEGYDRGEKLDHNKQIPSLRACVIIAQDTRRVELHQRHDDGTWRHTTAGPGESLELLGGDCVLDVDTIYDEALGSDAPST